MSGSDHALCTALALWGLAATPKQILSISPTVCGRDTQEGFLLSDHREFSLHFLTLKRELEMGWGISDGGAVWSMQSGRQRLQRPRWFFSCDGYNVEERILDQSNFLPGNASGVSMNPPQTHWGPTQAWPGLPPANAVASRASRGTSPWIQP